MTRLQVADAVVRITDAKERMQRMVNEMVVECERRKRKVNLSESKLVMIRSYL